MLMHHRGRRQPLALVEQEHRKSLMFVAAARRRQTIVTSGGKFHVDHRLLAPRVSILLGSLSTVGGKFVYRVLRMSKAEPSQQLSRLDVMPVLEAVVNHEATPISSRLFETRMNLRMCVHLVLGRNAACCVVGFPPQKWGSPVLNLNYLLHDVVERQRPLDWDGFWEKQAKQVCMSFVCVGRVLRKRSNHVSLGLLLVVCS